MSIASGSTGTAGSGSSTPASYTTSLPNLARDLESPFGDIINKNLYNTLWIGFQNIGGFSLDNDNYKDDLL
jgi:hypothetical protein